MVVMIKLNMYFSIRKKGIIQLPLMIGLLVMAVVLPVLTTIVKTNQDTRNKAFGTCNVAGYSCCYDDTHMWCENGLTCNASWKCEASGGGGATKTPTPPDCGITVGKPCCENSICGTGLKCDELTKQCVLACAVEGDFCCAPNGAIKTPYCMNGLTCDGIYCKKPVACGTEVGAKCCANSVCNPGLRCVGASDTSVGTCTLACAKVGDFCCNENGKSFCDMGLDCDMNGRCSNTCGTANNICCLVNGSAVCDNGLNCVNNLCVVPPTSTPVPVCNSVGASCCASGNTLYCNSNLKCDSNVKCSSTCGTKDKLCCIGTSGLICDNPLNCVNNSCVAPTATPTMTPITTPTITPTPTTAVVTNTPTPVIRGGCDYFDPVRGMIVMNMNPGQVECWNDKLVSCPSTGGTPIVTDCVAGGKICNPNKRECEYKWCSYNGQLFSPGQVGCDQSGSVIVTCPVTGNTPTIKTCNSDQKCKSENGVFSCVDKCIYNGVTYGEGTIKCDGNILVTCPQYGGKPVIKDCAATSQACDQNKQTCVEAVKKCTYGTLIIPASNKACSGNLLLDCPAAGGTPTVTDCTTSGQICDGSQKACVVAKKCSVCADTKVNYVGDDKKGADYNCDGIVNMGDYVIWRNEYVDKLNGKTQTRYEANGNCHFDPATKFVTGLDDYSLWRQTYLLK